MMKSHIIQLLKSTLDKLEVPEEPKSYSKRTLILMRQIEAQPGRYDESKAHQVYAQLKKEYPDIPKADLRYEIERVYQDEFKGKSV